MRKIKKIVLVIIVAVLCCSCTKTTEEINQAGTDSAQGDEIVNLQEVIQNMKSEQTTPTSTPTPAPTEEPIQINEDDIVFPEHEQVITEEDQVEPQGNDLQLVFLGDSIFDSNRDGTGIPYLTAVQCNADVYNLAIGGTTATIKLTQSAENEKWDSTGLQGVVKAMQKKIPTTIFEGTRTKEILDNPNVDFSKTDYFIIEYGINDYFEGAPRSYDDEPYSAYTYAGALRNAITDLREFAPDCTIILCPPHYCLFYNGERFVGDSNVTDKQTLFFNSYYDLGIDAYGADKYLEDGIHLTAEARQNYADALARIILANEETKNN